jgi:hypothetical protein
LLGLVDNYSQGGHKEGRPFCFSIEQREIPLQVMPKPVLLTCGGLLTACFVVASVQYGLVAANRYLVCGGIVLFGVLACISGRRAPQEVGDAVAGDSAASFAEQMSFTLRFWGPIMMVVGVGLFFLAPKPVVAAAPRQTSVISKPIAKAAPKPVSEPEPEAEQLPPGLKLTGLVLGSDKPGAMINGKFYQVGEHVLGAEVVSITESNVALKFKGTTHSLYLRDYISPGGQ